MNAQPECLSAAAIERYLQAQLSDREREDIEKHVENCSACLESLSSKAGTISFYGAADSIPAYAGDVHVSGTELAELMGAAFDLNSLGDLLSPPLAGGELGWLGGYRIVTVLGHGGMGIVFAGEDTELKRPVAVKAMLPEFAGNQEARARFRREAESAAAVKHDNIVVIHQVGEDRGHLFLVMEFLHGQSLEKRLEQAPALTLAEALHIAGEVALGLAAAHKNGLIHRDIKPANIFLETKDAGTRAKILDFGLARQQEIAPDAGERLTRKGAVIGTPPYMSPEQAYGDEVDFRTDLYSAGVMLYRLTAGKLPFVAASASGYAKAHLTEIPRDVRAENPAVPPLLGATIMQLLEKDPLRRPESAQALANVLDSVLRTELAQPSAPEAARPKRPKGRRLRRSLAAAALLLVLIGFWQFWWHGPGTSAPAPLTQHLIARIERTVDGQERVLAPDSPDKLARFLPLRVDEKLDLTCNVPGGYHAAFFLLDTRGKLRDLAPVEVTKSGALDEIRFPAEKTWRVEGPPGTAVFLACADRHAIPSVERLHDLLREGGAEPSPLEAPKADVLFLVNRDKVLLFAAEKVRDVVDTPLSKVQDYLRRLRSAAAAKFDYVWAAAVPVRERDVEEPTP